MAAALIPSSPPTGTGVWFDHGIDKRAHLAQIRFGVALQEEIQRQRCMDAHAVAEDLRVGSIVGDRHHAARTEHLHALVVTVDSLAAVIDHGKGAVFKGEGDHGGVPIAGPGEHRVHQHGGSRINFGNFASHQVTRHVEIVDGHVQEDTAGRPQVLFGRRTGIAAGDAQDVRLSHQTAGDGLADLQKVGIKAAVETHHHAYAAPGHFLIDGLHLFDREIDRLLAKDLFSAGGRVHDHLEVLVGGAADYDCIHLWEVQ